MWASLKMVLKITILAIMRMPTTNFDYDINMGISYQFGRYKQDISYQ